MGAYEKLSLMDVDISFSGVPAVHYSHYYGMETNIMGLIWIRS